MKFSKGDYFAGINNQTVPPGTMFTVNMDELMAGWVRWWDGKPTDHVMVRVADHIAPKKRIELGDDDETKWETDVKGERRDPWQFTNYLPMMNEKGELFTFTTGSRGGISAIAGLARRYANHRRRHPDVFPLIALGVDSYQHPNREFGRISRLRAESRLSRCTRYGRDCHRRGCGVRRQPLWRAFNPGAGQKRAMRE